jgi:uncharacterized protein Smg (DUF494 family)
MSEFNLQQSTDYSVNELAIVSKFGKVDIKGMFEEINIFDSMLAPCITGSIVILDAIGLSDQLLFDGTEILLIDVDKGENYFSLKRSFRIYKQSNRQNINQTSETYILHFVSEEMIYSNQQKINRSYNTTYAEAAVDILRTNLNISLTEFRGTFDSSLGIKKFIVPNLTPFDSLIWLSKRAIDNNKSPTFLFFQNNDGYNFCTVSSVIQKEPLFTVNFGVKNLNENLGNEIVGARDMQVISQFDFMKNTKAGVYSGSFIGFDPITRTVVKQKITYNDHYQNIPHNNKNPNIPIYTNREGRTNMQMENSRKSFFIFQTNQQDSEYVKKNDPESIQKEDDTPKYIFQRQAIMQTLMAQRVRIVLPGNFLISSGNTLNLEVPKRAFKSDNGDNIDRTLYGKYVILATRHIIRFDKHETVIDVVTDSTEKPFVIPNGSYDDTYKDY